jgi:hypothetical protein
MLANGIIPFLSVEGPSQPIFIIGCGRSGTTIFGTALSKHSKVCYLNERRDLWSSAYPETDIWTEKATARNGKMVLTAADAEIRKSRKLRRLFLLETVKTQKPILVEKLPINNFRLQFIHSIFPDARFIHIFRNGLEVARSIEKLSEKGKWFVPNSYKWNQLVQLAKTGKDTATLPELCTSYFDKGLLEWRLSTETAVSFLKGLSEDCFLEISYDDLTGEPVNTIERVLSFIGIENEPPVTNFVRDSIARRTDKLGNIPLSEKARIIGGELLPLSMTDGNGKGLTRLPKTPTVAATR